MAIALFLFGIEAGGFNGNINGRISRVVFVEVDGAAELLEAAVYFGDHHMTRRKVNTRMCRINLPRHLL
jgi:hypothetical protein